MPWFIGSARGIVKSDKFEIGRILHLKSEIPKSQIGPTEATSLGSSNLRFRDFGFELQDSFDFEIVRFHDSPCFVTN